MNYGHLYKWDVQDKHTPGPLPPVNILIFFFPYSFFPSLFMCILCQKLERWCWCCSFAFTHLCKVSLEKMAFPSLSWTHPCHCPVRTFPNTNLRPAASPELDTRTGWMSPASSIPDKHQLRHKRRDQSRMKHGSALTGPDVFVKLRMLFTSWTHCLCKVWRYEKYICSDHSIKVSEIKTLLLWVLCFAALV